MTMILRQDLLKFLETILGKYKEYGSGEECYFHCKFCKNPTPKFAINIVSGKWHCWHCNMKGGRLYSLLKKLGCSHTQMDTLRGILQDLPAYVAPTNEVTIVPSLPDEFVPLVHKKNSIFERHVELYLQSRNISSLDIERYNIGYCETGEYRNRIIIPSYDDRGMLNYFIARDIFDSPYRYKNPPFSKNVVFFENQINWNYPVVLVEGAFDAIAVRRNAVPIQGKIINQKTLVRIMESGCEQIYLALDSDALREIVKQANWLMRQGFEVFLVDMAGEKDPSQLGFESMSRLIKEAKSLSFTDIIKLKMK